MLHLRRTGELQYVWVSSKVISCKNRILKWTKKNCTHPSNKLLLSKVDAFNYSGNKTKNLAHSWFKKRKLKKTPTHPTFFFLLPPLKRERFYSTEKVVGRRRENPIDKLGEMPQDLSSKSFNSQNNSTC